MRHYYTIKNHIRDDIFELVDSEDSHYVYLQGIPYTNPEELIGKNISVSYLKPYIETAIGAQLED